MRLVDYGDLKDVNGEPLLVTARMGEPVVYYDDGLHLDGILAWGAFLEYVSEHGNDLPSITSPWAEDFELPLQRWVVPLPGGCEPDRRLLTGDGKVWGWKTSAAQADWLSHGKMEFRRRPAVSEMSRYTQAKSHNLGAGAHKAYDLAYPTALAFEIWWYAFGEFEVVERLLRRVTHIGKKGALGMGKVLEWKVERGAADRSVEHEGKLTRRMPRDGGLLRSVRAPYHHRSRRVPCADVGDAA